MQLPHVLLLLSSAVPQEKVDFARQVAPLLVTRCIECHGPDKSQGDLRLDARAFAFPAEGGTIVPGEPEASELLVRVTLPHDDADVMPAKGEPLDATTQALLRRWIAEGASWPEAGDRAIAAALAEQRLPKLVFELPALDDAEARALSEAVATLRARGATVRTVAANSEALEVSFASRKDRASDGDALLLAPLAKRLVWLDLSRSAVTDEGLEALKGLTELRRLVLANTKVGDVGLSHLAELPKLEVLNVWGTELGDAGLATLASMPKLQKLYAWRTKVTPEAARAATTRQPRLTIDLGAG